MFLTYRIALQASVAGARPRHAASGRPLRPGGLFLLAAVVLATLALSSAFSGTALAEPADVAVKEGVYAFKAGAFDIAKRKFEPLAKAGDREASYWLGQMYEGGLGVKKDAAKAVDYYRSAAEAGWAQAKLRLGEIYLQGTEELQDFKKARKWLERAAFDGIARAQADLAKLYANGWGGDRDPVWAYVWYEFAAKQGDFPAQQARDSLLKTMSANEVSEAQNLSRKIAPEVFGQTEDKMESVAAKPAKKVAKPVPKPAAQAQTPAQGEAASGLHKDSEGRESSLQDEEVKP